MNITSIHITNFRNLTDVELDGIPATLALFGLNGAGKSSILYALHMLLFGECVHTGRCSNKAITGSNAAALIKDHAPEAVIEATLDLGADTVTAHISIPRRGDKEWCCFDVDGVVREDIPNRAALWRLAGIKQAEAAVSARPAEYLGSKDLDSVLGDMLGTGINRDDVSAKCGGHYQWLVEFAGRHSLPLETAAHYQAIGDHAYKQRRTLNSEIKEAKTALEDAQAAVPGSVKDGHGRERTPEDLPAMHRGVANVEATLQALLVERGHAEAALSAIDRDLLTEQLQGAKDTLVYAERAATETDKAHQETQAALQTQQSARAEAVDQGRQATQAIDRARQVLATLETKEGQCPTCGHKYTKEERKRLLDPAQAQVQEAETAVEAAKAKAAELHAGLTPLHEAVTKARDAQQQAGVKQRDAVQAVATLEAKLVQPTARSVEAVAADIAASEAKIQRGRALIENLEKAFEIQSAEARIATAEAEHVHMDWCVKAFRDGEVLKSLVGNELEEFAARCNVELNPYGYELKGHVSGKRVQLLLRCPGQDYRPVTQCSDGQQVLAQYAVATAFASTCAPVMLDRLDSLDHQYRKQLLGRLRAYTVGTVIMAGAWQQPGADMAAKAAALQPAQLVWVEDGAVYSGSEVLPEVSRATSQSTAKEVAA